MNGTEGLPKDHGNVGFLGKYSGIEDAIVKLFPKEGYCISHMKVAEYTGQKLKGHKYHYSVIEPLLCLMGNQPSVIRMEHFFHTLGFANEKQFHCTGTWNNNMKLYVDDRVASTLEVWFTYYCMVALGR